MPGRGQGVAGRGRGRGAGGRHTEEIRKQALEMLAAGMSFKQVEGFPSPLCLGGKKTLIWF